jgi:hypothetical protein
VSSDDQVGVMSRWAVVVWCGSSGGVVRCRQRMSMSMSLASTLRKIYQPQKCVVVAAVVVVVCSEKSLKLEFENTRPTTPTQLDLGIIRVHQSSPNDTDAVPHLLPCMHRFCSSPLRCSLLCSFPFPACPHTDAAAAARLRTTRA